MRTAFLILAMIWIDGLIPGIAPPDVMQWALLGGCFIAFLQDMKELFK